MGRGNILKTGDAKFYGFHDGRAKLVWPEVTLTVEVIWKKRK